MVKNRPWYNKINILFQLISKPSFFFFCTSLSYLVSLSLVSAFVRTWAWKLLMIYDMYLNLFSSLCGCLGPTPGKKREKERKKTQTEGWHSLSSLQMPITVWKMGLEKQALSLTVFPFGRPSFRGLCWGMKNSRASAWMPYFSRVQAVRSSQRCFCSHHRAWSDQSRVISTLDTQNRRTNAI